MTSRTERPPLTWDKDSAEVYAVNTLCAAGLLAWSLLTEPDLRAHGTTVILGGSALAVALSWFLSFMVAGLPFHRPGTTRRRELGRTAQGGNAVSDIHNKNSEALRTLNAWLEARGEDVTRSTLEAWNISPYRDALVFSPAQSRRSNTLYVVRGSSVNQHSPAVASLEEAYLALDRMQQ